MLPVAEVQRDKEDSPAPLGSSLDNIEFAFGGNPVRNGNSTLNAPEIHKFCRKKPVDLFGFPLSNQAVAAEHRQQVLRHEFDPFRPQFHVDLRNPAEAGLQQSSRQNSHQRQARPPKTSPVHGGRPDGWGLALGLPTNQRQPPGGQ